MKKTAFLLSLVCAFFISNAQEKTVDQLNQKIQELEFLVKEQAERNDYLKEALDLRNAGVETTSENVTIKLTRLWGSESESRIYIQGIATVQGANQQTLQFDSHEIVSPNGNQYQAFSAGLPNDQNQTFRVAQAEPGIPYGFSIKVDDVNEKIPALALLRLKLYGTGIRGYVFDFKGLDLDWQD